MRQKWSIHVPHTVEHANNGLRNLDSVVDLVELVELTFAGQLQSSGHLLFRRVKLYRDMYSFV